MNIERFEETQDSVSALGQMEAVLLPPPLSGWQVVFEESEEVDGVEGADREILWLSLVGALVIGLSITLALALYRVIRREARLTQLKNDLVATVTHELKTPVASIRLLVDTLMSGNELDPVRVKDYLGLISRENSRLGHLIENFLSFSRMERNKDSLERVSVDAASVAREGGNGIPGATDRDRELSSARGRRQSSIHLRRCRGTQDCHRQSARKRSKITAALNRISYWLRSRSTAE